MTQETAIGVGTSEGASGTQCAASFFRLARALSGRCSWASLGVVFFESNLSEKGHWRSQSGSRHSFEGLVRALPQRNLNPKQHPSNRAGVCHAARMFTRRCLDASIANSTSEPCLETLRTPARQRPIHSTKSS